MISRNNERMLYAGFYGPAARAWNMGLDTCAIAKKLNCNEAAIYNKIGFIREEAKKLRDEIVQ